MGFTVQLCHGLRDITRKKEFTLNPGRYMPAIAHDRIKFSEHFMDETYGSSGKGELHGSLLSKNNKRKALLSPSVFSFFFLF